MEPYTRLAVVVKELRKFALGLGGITIAVTFGYYFYSPRLFSLLQKHLDQELVFLTVTEPFLAHVKLAFGACLFTLAPLFIFCGWKSLAKPFNLNQVNLIFFFLFTTALFYCGSLFCYFITLPYGIKFLLGFSSDQLTPTIAIGRFVSFVAIFILAFGTIFELPIFMVFCARTGLITGKTFEANRRYAVLAISIVAALLTPTPDVINMMLMGVPLYALYELGILTLRLMKA